MMCSSATAFGGAVCRTGPTALRQGAITIRPGGGASFVVFRVGPTSDRFFREVGERVVPGGFLGLVGALSLLFLFGGAERRAKMPAAGEATRLHRPARNRVPVRLAVAVVASIGLVVALLRSRG